VIGPASKKIQENDVGTYRKNISHLILLQKKTILKRKESQAEPLHSRISKIMTELKPSKSSEEITNACPKHLGAALCLALRPLLYDAKLFIQYLNDFLLRFITNGDFLSSDLFGDVCVHLGDFHELGLW